MMLNQHISKYIYILIFSAACMVLGGTNAFAQTVTDSAKKKVISVPKDVGADSSDKMKTVQIQGAAISNKKDTAAVEQKRQRQQIGHFLCIGADIYHPIYNHLVNNQESYEFTTDYYWKKDLYLVVDGGWGNSHVNYSDLKYTTSNQFLRVGMNRSLLLRQDSADWDMMCIGFRFGAATINRSAATYSVNDSLWGKISGSLPDKNINAYWAELLFGVRVQLYRSIYAGWAARVKFLLNGHSFTDLSPQYIAGYGRGDKNTVFDLNFYITYGIKWRRK